MEDQRPMFLALIAFWLVRFAYFRLQSPIKIFNFARKNEYFLFMGQISKTTTSITLANLWNFQILLRICIKNVICKMHFWYLFALMHFIFIFLQKCAPRLRQKHIFENQLWAISLQKSTFWSFECLKWRISGPSFWHLSLCCPFGSPFFGFSRPSEF